MSVILGLDASYSHDRNGMIKSDMAAAERVAAQLGDVISFRSTGPWAKRWIERGHPTKNFHVKGKSSDWGPQAGFVPYDALYSKKPQTQDRTTACDHSIAEGWARAVPLTLMREEIIMQLQRKEGDQTGIRREVPTESKDILLYAGPQGKADEYVFRARFVGGTSYEIHVYADQTAAKKQTNHYKLLDPKGLPTVPLLVMASNEDGANNKAITGDYDLFAVIPTWASYGSLTSSKIKKPGIQLMGGHGTQNKQSFKAGVGMDNVLDPSLHTFDKGPPKAHHAKQQKSYDALENATPRSEHKDMGNITPRVLRCINQLNKAMGAIGDKAWLRRVHHNAENYRNAMFGALTMKDMIDTEKGGGGYGDGFPLTVFLPPHPKLESTYGTCCTLENYSDLQNFGAALHHAGFYVPKNASWDLPKAYTMAH